MGRYLVRQAGTTKIHGIFWADTAEDLWDAVDEMAGPVLFEHAEITEAGGVWREDSMATVRPVPDRADFPKGGDGDQEFDNAVAAALNFRLTGWSNTMVAMLSAQHEFVWQRFDAADEGVGLLRQAWNEVHGKHEV